jgi:hypothetical protein
VNCALSTERLNLASRSRTESSTSSVSPPPLHVAPCLCLFDLNLDYGSDCTCLPLPSRIARVSNAVTVADAIAASPNRPRTMYRIPNVRGEPVFSVNDGRLVL